jgi:hypothetical protein
VLERQMKMRGEPTRAPDEVDDLVRAIHRLERADPEARVAVMRIKGPQ